VPAAPAWAEFGGDCDFEQAMKTHASVSKELVG
jgi:hypothetical protein